MTDITLNIRCTSAPDFKVKLKSTATIAELKRACMKDSRVAPEMQQFFYREKALEDAQTLEGCNIVNESVI
jgi:hypothetical protein